MKILIVEDEIKTGEYLRQGLREAGFNADLVHNGVDGLHLAQEGDYDLVILDVMLPGMDGWQVLTNLRRGGLEMPVLFLTAKDQVQDRIKGLELGRTTTWSNRFPLPSYWRERAPSSGVVAMAPR